MAPSDPSPGGPRGSPRALASAPMERCTVVDRRRDRQPDHHGELRAAPRYAAAVVECPCPAWPVRGHHRPPGCAGRFASAVEPGPGRATLAPGRGVCRPDAGGAPPRRRRCVLREHRRGGGRSPGPGVAQPRHSGRHRGRADLPSGVPGALLRALERGPGLPDRHPADLRLSLGSCRIGRAVGAPGVCQALPRTDAAVVALVRGCRDDHSGCHRRDPSVVRQLRIRPHLAGKGALSLGGLAVDLCLQPPVRGAAHHAGLALARRVPDRRGRLDVIRPVDRACRRAPGAGRRLSPLAPEPEDRGHRGAQLGLRARPGRPRPRPADGPPGILDPARRGAWG